MASKTINFNHRNIHVISDEHGIEIPDIGSELDNERFLKKCLELTLSFTSSLDTAVLFSVAGDLKTMSACLSLATQMYDRPQDRLYHTLVSNDRHLSISSFRPGSGSGMTAKPESRSYYP